MRLAYVLAALAAGLIQMTIPAKPNSRLQKYRLTEKGREWLG
jgi:DNA-binding PadR family transcriptional regulator